MTDRASESAGPVVVGMNAVIVAVTARVPRILTLPSPSRASGAGAAPLDALPFAMLDPARHPTLELGLRLMVGEEAGQELGYVEQLYTFGDRFRDPAEARGGSRALSVAYLALVHEAESGRGPARWRDVYAYLPWEDWREGRPGVIEQQIAPRLAAWVMEAGGAEAREQRRERLEIAFGLGGAPWDAERVLDRYELLYEARCVAEAPGSTGAPGADGPRGFGRPMTLDHRRMLASALGRLRGKLRYRPVVFELLPPTFTLLQLQQVVEALAGVLLHKANFRRLIENAGLVEGTGELDSSAGGRPAELFRFRREVLRERPAPGVGLPGTRSAGL